MPSSVSYDAYYWLQRQFGALRHPNPLENLMAGIDTCNRITEAGLPVVGGRFLEVGTGRRINTPLAFWLMGAERTVTVDLNHYLRPELIRADIAYISGNRNEVAALFGDRIHDNRLQSLLSFSNRSWHLRELLDQCGIEYLAPASAAHLELAENSIDYHTSYTVLEHIAESVIVDILIEGARVVRSGGLFAHRVDYSDHFSHSDPSISAINFLQYSDQEWQKIAGNRYMYMNRLRVDDFVAVYRRSGQEILSIESYEDSNAMRLLQNNELPVDKRFADKPIAVLATTGSWILSRAIA